MNSLRNIRRLVLLLILGVVFSSIPVHAQEPQSVTTIRSVDSSAFPSIRVDFTLEQNSQRVVGITNANVRLENDQPEGLLVQANLSDPITLIVIADINTGSNVEDIVETLAAYFDHFMNDNDNVILYQTTHRNEPARTVIENPSSGRIVVNRLTAAGSGEWLDGVLESALSDVEAVPQGQEAYVLLVTSYLFARDDDNLRIAERIASAGGQLHVVQAHTNRDTADLRILAAAGGGRFVENRSNTSTSQQQDQVRATGDLLNLYEDMQVGRTVYSLYYNTTSQSINANRSVSLIIEPPVGALTSTIYSYNPIFQAPIVEIIAPTNLNPTRSFIEGSDDLDSPQTFITARVIFPDNIRRSISSVQLNVINNIYGTVINETRFSVTDENPNDNLLLLTIPWELTSYAFPGTNYNVTLNLMVTDTVQIPLTSEVYTTTGTVFVAPVPPAPTIAPTYTIQPTYTLQPSPTPAPTYTPDRSSNILPVEVQEGLGISGEDADQVLFLGSWGIILVLIIFVLFLFTVRKPIARAAQRSVIFARTTVERMRTEILNRSAGDINDTSDTAYAKLDARDISGFEDTIQMTRKVFKIGRDSHVCHYAFPESLTYISGIHLQLSYDEDEDKLFVQDMGSSNGTTINGSTQPIKTGELFPIIDGDMIGIGSRMRIKVHVQSHSHKTETITDSRSRTVQPVAAGNGTPKMDDGVGWNDTSTEASHMHTIAETQDAEAWTPTIDAERIATNTEKITTASITPVYHSEQEDDDYSIKSDLPNSASSLKNNPLLKRLRDE